MSQNSDHNRRMQFEAIERMVAYVRGYDFTTYDRTGFRSGLKAAGTYQYIDLNERPGISGIKDATVTLASYEMPYGKEIAAIIEKIDLQWAYVTHIDEYTKLAKKIDPRKPQTFRAALELCERLGVDDAHFARGFKIRAVDGIVHRQIANRARNLNQEIAMPFSENTPENLYAYAQAMGTAFKVNVSSSTKKLVRPAIKNLQKWAKDYAFDATNEAASYTARFATIGLISQEDAETIGRMAFFMRQWMKDPLIAPPEDFHKATDTFNAVFGKYLGEDPPTGKRPKPQARKTTRTQEELLCA